MASQILFGAYLRLWTAVLLLLAIAWSTSALPSSSLRDQQPFIASSTGTDKSALAFDTDPTYWTTEEGVGHFSEWSKSTKRAFVDDVRVGKASDWVIVMGNEGGDLDSMTAALTWSYHLSHMAFNVSRPGPLAYKKAVALLQTPQDALDLRPENKLALHNVQMSPGHRDLLTIDELPLPAEELAVLVHGIVLVDHPVPRSVWNEARILSIFDHHKDRGIAPHAKPRIFEGTASCTTIVARQMLDELETLPEEYHLPHEVVELILDAIALDSDGLNRGTPEDKFTSRRLLKRSNWSKEKLLTVMQRLDDEMSKAKKDLDNLGIRDLLRRDWKGDIVRTKSRKYSQVHLGLASIPYSLEDQIQRTLHETTQSWFRVEEAWTKEIGADISLSLNSYKIRATAHGERVDYSSATVLSRSDDDSDDDEVEEYRQADNTINVLKKFKVRQICLVVRPSHRLDEEAAKSLFNRVKEAIDESPFLDAEPWSRVSELEPLQMVWVHHVANGGRKLIRPIVEDAVVNWEG